MKLRITISENFMAIVAKIILAFIPAIVVIVKLFIG